MMVRHINYVTFAAVIVIVVIVAMVTATVLQLLLLYWCYSVDRAFSCHLHHYHMLFC